MKHNYYLLLVALMLTSNNLCAQITTRALYGKEIANFVKFHSLSSTLTVEMDKVDVKKTMLEESKMKDKDLPPRYGIPLSVNIGLQDGKWEISPYGGYVWKVAIKSRDATTLNLLFDKLFLPQGAELYAYNSDESFLFGPVTSKDNNKYKNLATTILKGDVIFLELFEPIRSKGKSELHISTVVHGFMDITNKNSPPGTAGTIGGCHNNITCPEGNGVQNEADAVAMLVDVPNGRFCSGTLLNNACNNLRPNFLTAFHCLDGPDDEIDGNEAAAINNFLFIFNFRSTTCTGTEANIEQHFSLTGGNLASAFNQTDFALITLNQRPQLSTGIQYSGWNRNGNTPVSTVGIHHPRGNIMKVSLGNAPTISPNDRFWRVVWNDGTTESGSSGSGLFDNQNRLIGQLRGGAASCTNTAAFDDYGRVSQSWNGEGTVETRLRDHLTDDPSVTQTNTVGIPSFTFPDVICGSTPMSVNWNGMTNMNIAGGSLQGITGSAIPSATQLWFEPLPNYLGAGFLNVNFKPNGIICSDPLVLSKNFHLGTPTPQASFEDDGGCYGWLSVDNPLPGHTYSWKVTRGPSWYTYYLNGSTVFLSNWGNNYAWMTYELTATNACGSTTVIGNGNLTGCPNINGNNEDINALISKNYTPTLSISPNPATNDVTLNLKDIHPMLMNTLCDVNIVNQMGQTVISQKMILESTINLDISALANGFYVAHVKGENGLSLSQKLMVNKK